VKAFDFLNWHITDKKHRVIYFPPAGVTGEVATFTQVHTAPAPRPAL
jgi:hypothetical protein